MSREQAAACPLGADQFPLLAVARFLPERSLPELLAAVPLSNPTRRVFRHLADSDACRTQALVGEAQCCARGRRLVDAARSWRHRPQGGA
jgi:hypothetical protein